MRTIVVLVAGRRCEIERADARTLAAALLSRPGAASEALGLVLRELGRHRIDGPLDVFREEHENTLRLALARLGRDGSLSRPLSRLAHALDQGVPVG